MNLKDYCNKHKEHEVSENTEIDRAKSVPSLKDPNNYIDFSELNLGVGMRNTLENRNTFRRSIQEKIQERCILIGKSCSDVVFQEDPEDPNLIIIKIND